MANRGYETHEDFWSNLRHYLKLLSRGFRLGLFFQIVTLCYLSYTNLMELNEQTGLPGSVAFKYLSGFGGLFTNDLTIEKQLLPYSKGWAALSWDYYRIVADYATNNAYATFEQNIEKWFYWSFASYLISVIYITAFWSTAKSQDDKKFVRGAIITPISALNKKLAQAAKKSPLSTLKVGETILPFELEPKHMLILGTAGSGKGVLLNQLIVQINKRKQQHSTKCVFYDLKGEFVAKQLGKSDLIFSPFDQRSLKWNLFNDLETPPDFDVVARSLFASPEKSSAYWYNCAGDCFRTGLIYLKRNNKTSNAELWDFFSQPLIAIQAAFKTLPVSEQGALKHIDKSDSPASASIISILQERIQFFRYLVDVDGDFSFRKYIREEPAKKSTQPNLFILNIEQYATIFKPLMTLVIDMMAREVLSLPDKLDRRIFFIIDELGTLNRMDSVLQIETVGRSKGASLICANQDLGRIEEQYGRANLKTFYNNFNTTFTFRIREPETAEFLSRAIGEQQIIKTSQSRQLNPGEVGDRKSINEQEKLERLILPTEFQSLPDLHAIVNIAGFGISKIQIPAIFYPEKHDSFVLREFASMEAPMIEPDTPAPPKTNFEKLKI